jgi:prepilin signal peptidase PulO-like enzyme (type II secretory pathway)
MEKVILAAFCVAISVFDIKRLKIPNLLLVFWSAALLLLAVFRGIDGLSGRLMSGAVCYMVFCFIYLFTHGIGFGDVKFAALLGFSLGLEKVIFAFLATSCCGILLYLAGIKLYHWSETTRIPFAPLLSCGAMWSEVIDFHF